MAHTERVVVLVDMDCFYCQVEEKLDPCLQGKPIAVVQYIAWRGGGIIAVNYSARDQGVTRYMRGDEAKQKCPGIVLVKVPQLRGKADLTKYRNAGKEVAEVLRTFTNLLERASVDEAYLDITEEVKKRLQQGLDQIKIEKLANTFVVGSDTQNFINSLNEHSDFSESNIRLAIGGIITEEIRAEIFKKTGYKCSAGVAHNKILAKLVCGLHKPNKQTLLPQNAVAELYKDLPIKKIKSLGGKFGIALAEELQITFMGELARFSEKELSKKFDEKNVKWLFNIARGIDYEPVTVRLVSKSIGCCKKFPGRTALTTEQDVEHWISELATEISERLEKDLEENNRRAKQMVVSFAQETNKKDVSSSRTHPLQSYEQEKISRSALDVIRRFCLRADGSYCITFLGISVGSFQDLRNSGDISVIFKNMNQKELPKSNQEKPKYITSFFQNMGDKFTVVNLNKTLEKSDCCDEKASTPKHNTTKSFFQTWTSRCQDISPSHTESPKTVPMVSGVKVHFGSDISEPSPEHTTTDQTGMGKNELLSDNILKKEKMDTDLTDNQTNGTINNTEPIGSAIPKHEPNQIIAKSFFLNYFLTEGRHLLKPNTNLMKYAKSLDPTIELPVEPPQAGPSRLETTEFPCIEPVLDIDITTCPECNKEIRSSEYNSHLDYHFALKLVNEETQMYKEPNENVKKDDKNKNIGKTSKGESKEPSRILKLLQKGKMDDLDELNSEICADCNQRVRISDFAKHFDKHEKEGFSKINSQATILEKPQHLDNNHKIDNSKNPSGPFNDTESHEIDLDGYDSVEKWVPREPTNEVPSTSKDVDLFSDNSPEENQVSFVRDEHNDDSENNSVYSADTEDLNEDISNLIFFEDVFTESESSQPLFSSQEKMVIEENNLKEKQFERDAFMKLYEEPNNKGKISYSEQIVVIEDKQEPKGCIKRSTTSFSLEHVKREKQVVGRENAKKTKLLKDSETEEPKRNLVDFIPGESNISEKTVEDDQENCPECNRKIPFSELVSHMDYHFALKMVKEEAHLYKNPSVPFEEKPFNKNSTKNRSKSIQTSKRKLSDTKKIDIFLQKTSDEILDESNSELCEECNKRIKLDETVGHADYHAAKKLHSELNSPKMVNKSSLVKAKNKMNKSVMNMRSISNFFKA